MAELGLIAPGTSEEARLRALGIAAQVLRHAGVTADAAKLAVEKRDAWGDSGMSPLLQPDERDLRAAEAWEDASQAALMSCYRGRTIPLEAELYCQGATPAVDRPSA